MGRGRRKVRVHHEKTEYSRKNIYLEESRGTYLLRTCERLIFFPLVPCRLTLNYLQSPALLEAQPPLLYLCGSISFKKSHVRKTPLSPSL